MGTMDDRVDAYIKKSPLYAQPILEHVRALVHRACPEVVETIKWGMPFFEYKGPYFSIAAFKNHCAICFWKAKLLSDPDRLLTVAKSDGTSVMTNFGKVARLSDLPSDKLILGFLKQAKKLNDDGVKLPSKKVAPSSQPLAMPSCLTNALKKNKAAARVFKAFSPSNQREYIVWINEAKTESTRDRRLAQAMAWMAEGKTRNWKYKS